MPWTSWPSVTRTGPGSDADHHRPDRSRRGDRCRASRARRRIAPGWPRPGGHRRRTGPDARRPDRAPGRGRIPHRHRSHRADHAGCGGRDPGCGGGGADRPARPGSPGPGLPGRIRRRQRARRAHRRRGYGRRGGRVRRTRRGGWLPATACLADRAVPPRVQPVHRGQRRFAAGPAHPQPGPAGRARGIPPPGPGHRPVHPRRTAPAGVLLPVLVRRGVARARAGRLCGHRVHGHRGGGVLPPRRHAGPA